MFDWQTATIEALQDAFPESDIPHSVQVNFANQLREQFLFAYHAIANGEVAWRTADQIVSDLISELSSNHGLPYASPQTLHTLSKCWQSMPAWPGARDGISALRQRYLTVPLTVLSWRMAVGSSRRNAIEWDSVFSCDLLGVYKPDPRTYARTAEIMGLSPNELMMVAAHPSDLRAAINCGYHIAYVLPQLHDPGEDYAEADVDAFDIVAHDFPDLARQLT